MELQEFMSLVQYDVISNLEPGHYYAYAEENDVILIPIKQVTRITVGKEYTKIIVAEGKEKMTHALDKYQWRGAILVEIKP